MRVTSREVVAEHRHLVMMGKQPARERLAIFLQSRSDCYNRWHRNGATLILPMSRNEIANDLGMVVETISRLFTYMADMGALGVNRKSVRVLRPDLLAGLCPATALPERSAPGRPAPGDNAPAIDNGQVVRPGKGVNKSGPSDHCPRGDVRRPRSFPVETASCTPPRPTPPALPCRPTLPSRRWKARTGSRRCTMDAVLIRPIAPRIHARKGLHQPVVAGIAPFPLHGHIQAGQPGADRPDDRRRLREADGLRRAAHENGKLREIGVSRYSATGKDSQCECAVTVADDWRQRGLASC